MTTELVNKQSMLLDAKAPADILEILLNNQLEAAHAVSKASNSIEKAASAAASRVSKGGKLIYIGAGSSGLAALCDALELPGTFGLEREQIHILMAGGAENLLDFKAISEDDSKQAEADIHSANISKDDCAICVSASGTTPYTTKAIQILKSKGATTIAITNNEKSTALLEADIGIFLPTPSEIIAGSTRLGAGTAQKIALNMLSTLMAIHLGHIYDGYMVNLRANNIKLRKRALGIICQISGCTEEQATKHFHTSNGKVKIAVLLASGCKDHKTALSLLNEHDGNLRSALASL